ncbi:MAG: ISAs1 family transposase [Clostridiales bacterium]|nr:ISAs1 family transposase [Clostridiales bacterium]
MKAALFSQETIHEKANEIPVFQDMLEYIDVTGKIVTADALHCQRDTCATITDEAYKGDYVFGLKENQKTLHDDICDEINDDDIEVHEEIELLRYVSSV